MANKQEIDPKLLGETLFLVTVLRKDVIWPAGLDQYKDRVHELLFAGMLARMKVEELEQRVSQLESLADIGRKVSGSRDTESQTESRMEAYWPIYICARNLVEAGQGRRGLASKVKKNLGRKAPDVRQINRILEFFERIRPKEFE